MGNARTLRVFALKKMRMSPAVNMGREIKWYSIGWKVYEPYQYRRKATRHNSVPIISLMCFCLDGLAVSNGIVALSIFLFR